MSSDPWHSSHTLRCSKCFNMSIPTVSQAVVSKCQITSAPSSRLVVLDIPASEAPDALFIDLGTTGRRSTIQLTAFMQSRPSHTPSHVTIYLDGKL